MSRNQGDSLTDLSQALWAYLESFAPYGERSVKVERAHDALMDDIDAAVIDIEGIEYA